MDQQHDLSVETIVNAQAPGLRRRIEIASQAAPDGGGEARAVVEDDYHHFRVTVRHDGAVVTEAWADALRFPYTACPSASDQLATLVGMPLTRASGEVHRWTDGSLHCTHMIDLGGLAVAAAARGPGRRSYLGEVPDRVPAGRPHLGRTTSHLYRDGELILTWEVEDDVILGPAPFTNLNFYQGFARRVQETLPPDEAEAALVMRRCVAISPGRAIALDDKPHASSTGLCYAQQASRAAGAIRIKNSTRDFSGRVEELCQEDQAWLAFAE